MTLRKYLWLNGFRIRGYHRSKIARRFNTKGVFNKIPEGNGLVNDYPLEYLQSTRIIKVITDYLQEYSDSKIQE